MKSTGFVLGQVRQSVRESAFYACFGRCVHYSGITKTNLRRMTRRPRTEIDADTRRIELCEPRLALSASLASDLILEALELHTAATIEPASNQLDPIEFESADRCR